jgi:heat shock protein HslJ
MCLRELSPKEGLDVNIAKWAIAAAAAVVCAVVVSGCAPTGASTPDPRLAGTWHLIEAIEDGAPLPLNGSDITLAISSTSNTGGQSMCSPYTATVIGGIGSVFVRVVRKGGQRDACIPNAVVNVDTQYITTLQRSRFASLSDGALTLTSTNDSLLFVRNPPQQSPTIGDTSWTLYASPQEKTFTNASPNSGPVSLAFSRTGAIRLTARCVVYTSQLEIAGSTAAAPRFRAKNREIAGCTDFDRFSATAAASALIGPMLITLSPAAAHGDPATLIITNLGTSIPTIWRSTS